MEVDNVVRIMKTESEDKMDLPKNLPPSEFIQLKEEPVFKEECNVVEVSSDSEEAHSDIEIVHEIDNIARTMKEESATSDQVGSENNSDANKSIHSSDELSSDVTTPIGQTSGLNKRKRIVKKQNRRKKQSIGNKTTTQAIQSNAASSQIEKSGENTVRLTGRHFIYPLPETTKGKGRRNCYVCKHTKRRPEKRKETMYFCMDCNVSLCPCPCFEEYHTKLVF